MKTESNEEAFQLGRKVINESDLEFTVPYQGEVYTLKYPAPWQKAMIETEIARRLGGHPRDSFSQEHVAMLEAIAYADALVIQDKSPSTWKGAWKCYDENLLAELYNGYLHFRNELSERSRRE